MNMVQISPGTSVSEAYLISATTNTEQIEIRGRNDFSVKEKVLATIRLHGSIGGPMIEQCLGLTSADVAPAVNELEMEGKVCWDGGARYVLGDGALTPKELEIRNNFRRLYGELDDLKQKLSKVQRQRWFWCVVGVVAGLITGALFRQLV